MEQADPSWAQAEWVLRVLDLHVGAEPVLQDEYRPVLLRQLKRLKATGRAGFGMVLGKRATEHRLLMAPNRPARSLAGTLARQTGLQIMTWGEVAPHADRPATLQLSLEGQHLPGLCKKGARMLRAFRPLPFSHLVLVRDGAEVADMPDPTDDDADEPGGLLADAPLVISRQAVTLQMAAQARMPFCEECALR